MQTDIQTQIASAHGDLMEAFRLGDTSSLAALYEPDAIVMPPDRDFVTDPGTIQSVWKSIIATGVKQVALKTMDIDSHEHTGFSGQKGWDAWEVGTYSFEDNNGRILERGKYVLIWVHRRGRVMIRWHIWNSSPSL
jgi:hypothetical protein